MKRDISNPCQPVRFREDNGWLVRFYYYEHRISLEVFHALSDGAGALVFFRTLLAVYLREMGHTIPNGPGILDVEEPPHREELEDAYARYATVRSLRAGIGKKAFQNTGTPEPFYTLNVTMGFVPVDQLKARAKSYGVSITEYLTGALLKVILENQAREEPRHPKPVALAIPINLRPWFPSETLRNFILTVRPCIDPSLGEYTFPEILSQVHHYMRLHINRQEMQALLTGNVRFQTNRVLQLIPIWLKNPVMSLSYRLAGTRPYSGTYTNPARSPCPRRCPPYPADGGHSGTGHQPAGPLCLHQLRQHHGDHLCRDPSGDRYRAGVFPLPGPGGPPGQGGEQPERPLRAAVLSFA